MASIRKHGKDWQAQVAIKGVRRSRKFPTKREAQDWANREEYLIKSGEGQYGPGTLGDLFERYAREVSPSKRGARWEAIRLAKFQREDLAKILVKNLRPGDFAEWRDRRLKEVSPASVARELQTMSAVMTRAWREWGVVSSNPVSMIEKPKRPPPRDRRVLEGEIEALEAAVSTVNERKAVAAFRFAVETAMRQGEIAGLTKSHIKGSVAHLETTKNGTARDVPLSTTALAMIEDMPEGLFEMKAASIDVLFRRVRDRTLIEDLHFHDSRAEAVRRISKKVDVLSLARIVGHKDIRQLMTYYREAPEDLAQRLG